MRCPFQIALILLLGGLPSRDARADTIHVPGDHDTIQDAVTAAQAGDTVLIHAGVYEEVVVISSKTDVTVRAQGKVVIDPPEDAHALHVAGCTNLTLDKLRVTGAS